MPPRMHIQFAAGDLEPELHARSGPGERPEWTAHRDLRRYYDLLALELARVSLSESNATILVAALNGTLTSQAEQARYLWASVEDYLRYAREDLDARTVASADEIKRQEDSRAVGDALFGSHAAGESLAESLSERGAAVLVAKLRALTPAQALAVTDACERYWTLVSSSEPPDHPQLLRAVGLLRD